MDVKVGFSTSIRVGSVHSVVLLISIFHTLRVYETEKNHRFVPRHCSRYFKFEKLSEKFWVNFLENGVLELIEFLILIELNFHCPSNYEIY